MVINKKAKPTKTSLLKSYVAKRNFKQSPEPSDKAPRTKKNKSYHFVIHKHAASRLHYDLRLECEGVLCSWAIPRGPSMDPLVNRLSVRVEDHPLKYRDFETVIPPGNYGAGTMMIWDEGELRLYETLPGETHDETFRRQYRKGNLKIELLGQKVRGRFALVKLKKSTQDEWLLVKKRDQYATTEDVLLHDKSVRSGLSMEGIAASLVSVKTKAKVAEKKIKKIDLAKEIVSLLKAAKKSEIPAKIKVMRPKKTTQSFENALIQNAPMGMVVLAKIALEGVEIRSTVGLNLTPRFREICQALKELPPQSVLLGVVNLGKSPVFQVFDLLWLDGKAVHALPLKKRFEILKLLNMRAPVTGLKPVATLAEAKSGAVWLRDLDASFEFDSSSDAWLEMTVRGQGPRSAGTVTTVRAPLTNPTKIFWAKEKITKQDLYQYYKDMADVMLPYLEDRPESLNRHPDGHAGKSFFQKEVAGSVPGWIETTHVAAYGGTKTVTYLLCQNADTLLYMVNMGCIEINPWLSRIPNLTKPDFAVVDIDPGTRPFSDVIEGALVVKKLFEKLGVKAVCKTSGSKGVHIFVPTDGKVEFSECQQFAEYVGKYMERALPEISSTKSSPLVRRDKLYIDALQNRKGQTMAAAYSVRPRAGALVSTPIAWSELNQKLDPTVFTLRTVRERVKKKGDLWAPVLKEKNDIRALNKALEKLLRIKGSE